MSARAEVTDLEPPAIAPAGFGAGTRLADRFVLRHRLGAGGGGTVWHAFDDKTGEQLAIKLMAPTTDAEVARWRREVVLARRVVHRGVCRVHDLGEADGCRWVTMALISGLTLRAHLQTGPSAAARHRLVVELVEAVAAIHAAGVVHRDLKPDNIVIDADGHPVVVDFGLAITPATSEPADPGTGSAPAAHVTAVGAVVGTPRYMAPEQAAGHAADARSDVYALGLVIREVLGDAAGSGVWRAVVARATAPRPDDRFVDAGALRAALHRRRGRHVALGALGVGGLVGVAAVAWLDRAPSPAAVVARRVTVSDLEHLPTSVGLSPDGQTIAYGVGATVIRRAVAGGPTQVLALPTTDAATVVAVAGVLADGRVVVDARDRRGRWAVWLLAPTQAARVVYQPAGPCVTALAPDGRALAVAERGRAIVVVPIDGGPARPLAVLQADEDVGGLAWSPDGAQLAFAVHPRARSAARVEVARVADGHRRVVAQTPRPIADDPLLVWVGRDRVAYTTELAPDGVALVATAATAPEPPVTLARWPGEQIGRGAFAAGRLVLLRGSRQERLAVGRLSSLGYGVAIKPIALDDRAARAPAGWSADGVVCAARTAAGDDDVVRGGAGALDVLVAGPDDARPDAVVDDAVVFERRTAAGVEVWRRGGDGALAPLATVADGGAAAAVRCAGDRTVPCLLAVPDGETTRFRAFDPTTGALGAVRASLDLGRVRDFAVAPDGGVLAVVDGSATVTFVALADGAVTRRDAAAPAHAVSWSSDGHSVLVAAAGDVRHRPALVRLELGGGRREVVASATRAFGRAVESPTGLAVAVEIVDRAHDVWVIDGLAQP